VLHKLKIILFPFLLRKDDWKQGASGSFGVDSNTFGDISEDDNNGFTPRNDLQAPDLYIPLMSFVTFLLITCVSAGLEASKALEPVKEGETAPKKTDEFRSDKLTYVFSKCLFIWIFEVLV